jgi:nitric oxide reductase large subunit
VVPLSIVAAAATSWRLARRRRELNVDRRTLLVTAGVMAVLAVAAGAAGYSLS